MRAAMRRFWTYSVDCYGRPLTDTTVARPTANHIHGLQPSLEVQPNVGPSTVPVGFDVECCL